MSVREDGQYYTADSFYADAGEHYTDTDKGHKLPGNTLESVHVESRLFVYLKTFENFVGRKPIHRIQEIWHELVLRSKECPTLISNRLSTGLAK
jgi:transcription elongation factor GreA-like protein